MFDSDRITRLERDRVTHFFRAFHYRGYARNEVFAFEGGNEALQGTDLAFGRFAPRFQCRYTVLQILDVVAYVRVVVLFAPDQHRRGRECEDK